jgi:hypothetical protein
MSENDVMAFSPPAPAFGAFDPLKWMQAALDSYNDSKSSLASFDVPRELVQPLLGLLRQSNTAADMLFYDVGLLGLRLLTRGFSVTTGSAPFPALAQDGAGGGGGRGQIHQPRRAHQSRRHDPGRRCASRALRSQL